MPQAIYERVRDNWKRVRESSNPHPHKEFARIIKEEIGLVDPKTGGYYRESGTINIPTLAKERKKTVADFDLVAVTEGLLGHEAAKALLTEGRWLSEEAVAPVGPSFFANVSAWTATVGGLVQGAILEGYETSEFDLLGIFPTLPVRFWQGGERLVAIIGPSRPAPKVGPGESHPDARMDAMWVEPSAVAKYGHKITVARETAYVDLTGGGVVAQARELGRGLRYREQELTLDVICGQTNNFKLGLTSDAAATAYNTYGATVPTGPGATATLANDIVNPMTDPQTTFNASQESLLAYRHPVTGLPMPMADRLTTVLLPSNLQWFATFLNTVSQIQVGFQGAAPNPQIAGSTFPTGWMTGNNPFAGLFREVRVSQWLYNRHTASTTQTDPDLSPGLGLTVANSRRWYRLDPARFAARRVAWEVEQRDFDPLSFPMLDQGLVFGTLANMGVQIQVLNPWAIQRNKVV